MKKIFLLSIFSVMSLVIHSQTNGMIGDSMITLKVDNVSFNLIKVEAGSFIMGGTDEQEIDYKNYYSNRPGTCPVTLTEDYYIGEYVVTQELWSVVMGTSVREMCKKYGMECETKEIEGHNYPMVWVSWNDAQEFCKKLSRITGYHFSLPTEAEWEYAARGGKKSKNCKFCGSNNLNDVAWNKKNINGKSLHPVGLLQPNELGIYDMCGNVYEFCQDWYYSPLPRSPRTDYQGPSSGTDKVLKNTAYGDEGSPYARVWGRSSMDLDEGSDVVSFRIVLHY